MRLFEVDVQPRDGGVLFLSLRGELDLSTIQQLDRALSSEVDGRAKVVVIDLRELTFLDSTGLRSMLRLHSRLESSGGRLVLVKGPRRVQKVFELTGAGEELEIVVDPVEVGARPSLCAEGG